MPDVDASKIDPIPLRVQGGGAALFAIGLGLMLAAPTHSVGGFFGALVLGFICGIIGVGVLNVVAIFWFSMLWKNAEKRVNRVASISSGVAIGLVGGIAILGGLTTFGMPSQRQANAAVSSDLPSAASMTTNAPEDKHDERKALADYWNPMAATYLALRSQFGPAYAAMQSGDAATASEDLAKAAEEAQALTTQTSGTTIPDGLEFSDKCINPDTAFQSMKDSFDSMHSALDSGKPSEFADAKEKLEFAELEFTICRHDVAVRYAALGGNAAALISLPSN